MIDVCFLCNKYLLISEDWWRECYDCGLRIRSYDDNTFSIENRDVYLCSNINVNKDNENIHSYRFFYQNSDVVEYKVNEAINLEQLISIFIYLCENHHLL